MVKPLRIPKEHLDDLLKGEGTYKKRAEDPNNHVARYIMHVEQSRYELALLEIDLMPKNILKDALYAGLAVRMAGEGNYKEGSTTQKTYIDKMLKYCEKNSKYLK